ncbi:hypothetical protein MNBD_GAMMA03-249 [hydrothermal vent metagenome]|uniref:Uncharacterized protein n=1 Tax=hydrothermal vent metagenome TaxID=652676 RepID=A0A3B0W3T3_9ZZZZ
MKGAASIVVVIILLLVYVFFFHDPMQPELVRPINHVSWQKTSVENKEDATTKIKVKIKPVMDEQEIIIADNNQVSTDNKELDYISAYRDWQYFANCYTDVEDFHNNKDPLQTLAERFENNPREAQTEPTPQQNMYYQQHVEICKAMIDDDKDDYYQIMQKLKQRFEQITPKTSEDKQLAQALNMVQQIQTLEREYSRTQYGKSSLPESELDAINSQIQQLTTAMMEVYDGNEVLSEQDTITIKLYSEEIDKLSQQIIKSNSVNEELVTETEAHIAAYLQTIDDYLPSVQSPDAFLLLAGRLYQASYFKKDTALIKVLKNSTGIYDSYYINMLNKIVMPLLACSMNYPCDAQSDYMLSYCLGLKDSMFNQACGLSLEDFYFSFYIGTNQLNDVNNYFNFLVNRYAK